MRRSSRSARTARMSFAFRRSPVRSTFFSGSVVSSISRIAAWNAQIQRWVDSSDDISLFPYAAAITDYELTNGSALFDGSHADVDILTELMRTRLLDVILDAARRR